MLGAIPPRREFEELAARMMKAVPCIVAYAAATVMAACGISINTLPPAPSGPETPCGAVDLGEFRVRVKSGFPSGTFVLESLEDSTTFSIVWPAGFYVGETDSGMAVFESGGSPIAREGDVLQIGGGHGGSTIITVCEIEGDIYT